MAAPTISDDLRRFILTKIASVPHLEALLLLRASPDEWTGDVVARRLYVDERTALKLLDELCAMGALTVTPEKSYRYAPKSAELAELIDRLATAYSMNLVGISQLIHSRMDRQVQQFADAFNWRKDR